MQRRGHVAWPGPALALVIITLGLLTACGAGQGDDETIVIGATIPITGPKAEEGRYTRDGYMLYIDAINSQGGIVVGGKRYRIALRYYDDKSDQARVAPLYRKLIAEDRVDFLLGPYSSALTAEAAPLADEFQIPMVSAHASAEQIFEQGGRYAFSIISPARNYLRGIIAVVLDQDPSIRSLALLGADEPFSHEALDGALSYAKERGLTVVYQGYYPLNVTDGRAALRDVKARDPDILLVAGHLQDAILLVRQARELDLSPRAMGFTSGPSTLEFRANLQSGADYIFGATQWTSALEYTGDGLWATPREYTEAFQATYPGYDQVPYQAAESSAALIALQRALEQAGTHERAAVRDALAALDMMTFYGRIKFDERGVNIYKPMAVEQIFPNGRRYTVFPSSVAERAPLYPMPPWGERSAP